MPARLLPFATVVGVRILHLRSADRSAVTAAAGLVAGGGGRSRGPQ